MACYLCVITDLVTPANSDQQYFAGWVSNMNIIIDQIHQWVNEKTAGTPFTPEEVATLNPMGTITNAGYTVTVTDANANLLIG